MSESSQTTWKFKPSLATRACADTTAVKMRSFMAIRGYYLGCPGWGLKSWVGRLFPSGTRNTDFLARYAEVFNTVEGNTTFYALRRKDTVARWKDESPDEFRFCFKFPKKITHE